VHDWKSCVRATVPRDTVLVLQPLLNVVATASRRRRRPVNPSLSAHDAYRSWYAFFCLCGTLPLGRLGMR
jgi:hypothetical protein